VCRVLLALMAPTVAAMSVPASVLAAACAPRPPVGVQVSRAADGRLDVLLRAGSGLVQEVRLGTAQGATITLPAGTVGANGPLGPAQLEGGTGDLAVRPPTPSATFGFSLVPNPPQAGGLRGAATLPLVAVDGCGEWRTFVGGGRTAVNPAVSIDDVSVGEGQAGTTNATFTVRLSGSSGQVVTVQYATSDGTAVAPDDYAAIPPTTMSFAPGETSKQVTVAVKGDALYEPNEAFLLTASHATNAVIARGQGAATIRNDDVPPAVSLSLSAGPMVEAGGQATVTASLSNPSAQPVTVDLGWAGTASFPADYGRSGTQVVIPPGRTSSSIVLTATDDAVDELDETVAVTIATVTNGTVGTPSGVTATIPDDDGPTVALSVDRTSLDEFDPAHRTATVTATLSAMSPQDVTVALALGGTATLGADYTASATTIAIPAGSLNAATSVTVVQDTLGEPAEAITVDIAGVTHGTEQGTQRVTISIAASGALYAADNFEHGLGAWSKQGPGSATVQGATANSGAAAAELTNTLGAFVALATGLEGGPQSETYSRFCFRLAAGLAATSVLAQGRDPFGNTMWEVDYDDARKSLDVYFINGARIRSELYPAAGLIATDAWYCAEVRMSAVAAGRGEIWLNGTSIGSVDTDLSAAQPYSQLYLWNTATVGTIFYDDVKVTHSYNGPVGAGATPLP